MQIILTNEEIHKALIEYAKSQGITAKDKQIRIEILARRNPVSYEATITVEPLPGPYVNKATLPSFTDPDATEVF